MIPRRYSLTFFAQRHLLTMLIELEFRFGGMLFLDDVVVQKAEDISGLMGSSFRRLLLKAHDGVRASEPLLTPINFGITRRTIGVRSNSARWSSCRSWPRFSQDPSQSCTSEREHSPAPRHHQLNQRICLGSDDQNGVHVQNSANRRPRNGQ